MTLHDIENGLPLIIKFTYCNSYVQVHVHENHMGNLFYDSEGELYYKSLCYHNDIEEHDRRDTFLSYFDHVLLISIARKYNNVDLQIYKIEPKFRVVYK